MEILILAFDALYTGAWRVHKFWRECIESIEDNDLERFLEVVTSYPGIARRAFPYLFDLARRASEIEAHRLAVGTLEPEEEEELRRIKEQVEKEMKNLWDVIDIKVVDSYEDLILLTTGSDELREIYRGVITETGILEVLSEAKLEHKYRSMADVCGELYDIIIRWFKEIEWTVMGGMSPT